MCWSADFLAGINFASEVCCCAECECEWWRIYYQMCWRGNVDDVKNYLCKGACVSGKRFPSKVRPLVGAIVRVHLEMSCLSYGATYCIWAPKNE